MSLEDKNWPFIPCKTDFSLDVIIPVEPEYKSYLDLKNTPSSYIGYDGYYYDGPLKGQDSAPDLTKRIKYSWRRYNELKQLRIMLDSLKPTKITFSMRLRSVLKKFGVI